jgi:hypothetical protein
MGGAITHGEGARAPACRVPPGFNVPSFGHGST